MSVIVLERTSETSIFLHVPLSTINTVFYFMCQSSGGGNRNYLVLILNEITCFFVFFLDASHII